MKKKILSPDFIPIWTAINTIAATCSMIALITTVYLSSNAMRDSMKTFNQNFETSNYTELDSMYFELLKLALEKPYLTHPAALKDAKQLQEYDIYANMVWNFIETITDRCNDNKKLEATWYPVVDALNRLHRNWFDDPKNKHKFKDAFREYIVQDRYKPWTVAGA